MIRCLLVYLALSGVLSAATGDILSVTVNSDGFTADVVVDNLSTGGTYSWGWDSTNSVTGSTPGVTFTVVSLGYNGSGDATTITRTVYGTKATRVPGSSSLNESVAGGDVTIRIGLSDYIYAKDKTGAGNSGTAPTVSFLANWYSQGGNNSNAASGVAVTNNSTAAYQPAIGNWTMPPFQRITGNFKLRSLAFQRDGQQGIPVRAVKYTVTDESAHSVTAWAAMTVSNDDGDAVPIDEWIATIDVSTLTQDDVLTCQMQAFPWVGDSDAVLDTSTSGYTQPDARHAPLLLLNDKADGYGVTYAKVSTTGSDTTGQAYPAESWDYTTAAAFLTLAKAARAIRDYNSANRSRDDVGGGVVQIAAGSYSAFGSTQAGGYGSTPETWITFEPGAGVTGTDVIINGDTGDGDISDRVRMKDVKVTTTLSGSFTGINAVWWDGVTIDAANSTLLNPGTHWFTQCTIPQLTQGLRAFSTNATYIALVRGCNLTGFNKDTIGHTIIGNLSTSGTPSFHTCINLQTGYPADSYILAYNKILSFDTASRISYMNKAYQYASTYEPQRGSAFVQNLFERLGTDGTTPVSEIASSGNPSFNVLVWNNTMMGQRQNWAYNDSGSSAVNQVLWSVKNNILWDFNIKSDNFAPANAARIGNWGPFLGVGWSGNVLADSGNGFDAEWAGRNGNQTDWPNTGWFGFTSYAANTGSGTAGAGGGDYTLTESSPALGIAVDWLLSHDLAGNVRGATDSAGAYTTYVAPSPTSTLNATNSTVGTITTP